MYTEVTVKHTGHKLLVREYTGTAIDDIRPAAVKEYCGICL